jgi:hypothetical protein
MREPLTVPGDLTTLQREYDAAHEAVNRYIIKVDAGNGPADIADVDAIVHACT